MNSRLYEGRVWHRRNAPRTHTFAYRTFHLYLDLAELPALFDPFPGWSARGPALARFRRTDYHGDPDRALDEAVRDTVAAHTGMRPAGPVRLLTHLRYLGYCFNPVSFYYCFDHAGEQVEFVMAEITNTPWDERHVYVLDLRDTTRGTGRDFDKAFHVSPFMPMSQRYVWSFPTPGDALTVSMRTVEDGRDVFAAGLHLAARPLTVRSLTGVLLRYPAMTLKVSGAIYWQALRLWARGIPFHSHPKHHDNTTREGKVADAKEMHT